MIDELHCQNCGKPVFVNVKQSSDLKKISRMLKDQALRCKGCRRVAINPIPQGFNYNTCWLK